MSVIFSESFDSPASAGQFTERAFGPDNFRSYGFDYSAGPSSRLTSPIGSAPGGGSMTGLLVAANQTGIYTAAGLNFYPNIPAQSGSYRLQFDVYAGVNNVAGTTEMISAGAQASGDRVNIDAGNFRDRDGDWFQTSTDGGIGNDYITFTRRSGTQIAETQLNNTDPNLQLAFPSTTYPVAGSPGEGWTTVTVDADSETTTFMLNGVTISSISNSDWTSGKPFFGYSDLFRSVAGGETPSVWSGIDFDPFNASYAIFDNITVSVPSAPVPEPTSVLIAIGLTGLSLIRRRSR